MAIFKVVHLRDDIESVFLVQDQTGHDARHQVLTALDIESVPTDKWAITEFSCAQPYKLYTLDRKTGEMVV